MKKLLITLGTIGTIVAPVATVVACGSSTPAATPEKDAAFAKFEAAATAKGFSLANLKTTANAAALNQLKDVLFAADKATDFGTAHKGLLTTDLSHGADDFAFLVKGTRTATTVDNQVVKDNSPVTGVTDGKNEYILSDATLNTGSHGSSSDTFAQRWDGIKEAELQASTAFITLHKIEDVATPANTKYFIQLSSLSTFKTLNATDKVETVVAKDLFDIEISKA